MMSELEIPEFEIYALKYAGPFFSSGAFLLWMRDWEKTLDPRILSFLKKSDIIFEPYDALDLIAILNLRAKKALRMGKIDQAALKKIAAYASRETGDARKAVELLSKAVQEKVPPSFRERSR